MMDVVMSESFLAWVAQGAIVFVAMSIGVATIIWAEEADND